MSKIGRQPIPLPDKVKVAVNGSSVNVEGPKGKLALTLPEVLAARMEDAQLHIENKGATRQDRAMHGLFRSLTANMVKGVHTGFTQELEIQGVGFKAVVQGKNLVLNLGFSHQIFYPIHDQLKITVTDNTKVLIEGIDKQLVGAAAAEIYGFAPAEPYKGKGVRYKGQKVRRKAGKTAQSK